MTTQSNPAAMVLAGNDGHLYRFPTDAMARWRQPAGAAPVGTDDPNYTSPDGTCYVIPRAEVEGYCMSDEENAALRSQFEQRASADVSGYALSGCPPGYTQTIVAGDGGPGTEYLCVSIPAYERNMGISVTPAISPIGFFH